MNENISDRKTITELKSEYFILRSLLRKIENDTYQLGDKPYLPGSTFNNQYLKTLNQFRNYNDNERKLFCVNQYLKSLDKQTVITQLKKTLICISFQINFTILLDVIRDPSEDSLRVIVNHLNLLWTLAKLLNDKNLLYQHQKLSRCIYSGSLQADEWENDRLDMHKALAHMFLKLHFSLTDTDDTNRLIKHYYNHQQFLQTQKIIPALPGIIRNLLDKRYVHEKRLTIQNQALYITPLIDQERDLTITKSDLHIYLEGKNHILKQCDLNMQIAFKYAANNLLKLYTTKIITRSEKEFKEEIDALLQITLHIEELKPKYQTYKSTQRKTLISNVKATILNKLYTGYCEILKEEHLSLITILEKTNTLLNNMIALIPANFMEFFGKENKLRALLSDTKNLVITILEECNESIKNSLIVHEIK